jgi:pyruvate formate lyase activating enzyme
VYDVAKQNKKDTVLVTNGFINHEPLINILPYISAMNIDLKSINPTFYKDICSGALENVQNTIMIAYEHTHIELTFLAIPSLNDTKEEMSKLSGWIADIDKNIPLHIISFRPMYKMTDVPHQTYQKILELKEIASKKLRYVY